MSNVDLVRASVEAYERDDFDAMVEMMHPDFGLSEEQIRQEAR